MDITPNVLLKVVEGVTVNSGQKVVIKILDSGGSLVESIYEGQVPDGKTLTATFIYGGKLQ